MFPFSPVIGGVVLTIGIGLGLGFGIADYVTNAGSVYSGSVNQTKTFDAKSISTVHINVDAADVHVLHGTGTKIQVHVYGDASGAGNRLRFTAKASDSDLRVRVTHPWTDYFFTSLPWGGGWTENLVHVDVEVPDGIYDSFNVDTKAGDLLVDDITAKQVAVESDAGNVRVSNVRGALNAFTHAGDMDIQKVAGAIDVRTDAGKIVVDEDSIQHDITTRSSAGSIDVNLRTVPDNLQFQLNTDFGKAQTNLPNVKTAWNNSSDVEGSIGTGGPHVELHSGLGDVSLQVK